MLLVLAKLIGLLILGVGVWFLIQPSAVKRVLDFFLEGKRIYAKGAIRAVLGLLILLAVPSAHHGAVLLVLGVMMSTSGILVFLIGLERIRTLLEWWKGSSVTVFRVMALLAMFIGAMILYSA